MDNIPQLPPHLVGISLRCEFYSPSQMPKQSKSQLPTTITSSITCPLVAAFPSQLYSVSPGPNNLPAFKSLDLFLGEPKLRHRPLDLQFYIFISPKEDLAPGSLLYPKAWHPWQLQCLSGPEIQRPIKHHSLFFPISLFPAPCLNCSPSPPPSAQWAPESLQAWGPLPQKRHPKDTLSSGSLHYSPSLHFIFFLHSISHNVQLCIRRFILSSSASSTNLYVPWGQGTCQFHLLSQSQHLE